MSQQDFHSDPGDHEHDVPSVPEAGNETLTDLVDRIEREAFLRSLSHREPAETTSV